MRQTMFLVALGAGIAFMLSGLFITRQTWRPDIEPYGRRSRLFQIALHPERYATPQRLPLIRALYLVGALLLLSALGVALFDIAAGPH